MRAELKRSLGLLAGLYFAQGLPYGFFTQALPLIMRQQAYSLAEIGFASLLSVPWALKFLWAPLVDRFGSARLGRRKSWILPLQGLMILALAGVALTSPDAEVKALLYAFLAMNLLSATQDIATDGLAVDLLAKEERGLANGLQVGGYRVGMVVGGGVLLVLHQYIGWSGIFFAMAGLIFLTSLPVLSARERGVVEAGTGRASIFDHAPIVAILPILVTFKFGEAFGNRMLQPYLNDRGLSLADVGWMVGTVGSVAGFAGALLGGALVNRLGRRRALVYFGALQALGVASYAATVSLVSPTEALWFCTALEHFTSGMATAALFTLMMDACAPERAATHYTVQASLVVIVTGAAATLSGVSAQFLGYTAHFLLGAALSVVAVAVVLRNRALRSA